MRFRTRTSLGSTNKTIPGHGHVYLSCGNEIHLCFDDEETCGVVAHIEMNIKDARQLARELNMILMFNESEEEEKYRQGGGYEFL